jgi:pilus assembly protein FimV
LSGLSDGGELSLDSDSASLGLDDDSSLSGLSDGDELSLDSNSASLGLDDESSLSGLSDGDELSLDSDSASLGLDDESSLSGLSDDDDLNSLNLDSDDGSDLSALGLLEETNEDELSLDSLGELELDEEFDLSSLESDDLEKSSLGESETTAKDVVSQETLDSGTVQPVVSNHEAAEFVDTSDVANIPEPLDVSEEEFESSTEPVSYFELDDDGESVLNDDFTLEGEALFVPPQPATSSFAVSAATPAVPVATVEQVSELPVVPEENLKVEPPPMLAATEQTVVEEVALVEENRITSEPTELTETHLATSDIPTGEAEIIDLLPPHEEEIAFSDPLAPELEDEIDSFSAEELLPDAEETEFTPASDEMGMTEEELAAFIEAESAEGLDEASEEFHLGDDLTDDDMTQFSAVESDGEAEQTLESLQQNTHLSLDDDEHFAGLEAELSEDDDTDDPLQSLDTADEADESYLNTMESSHNHFATGDEDDLDKLLSRLNEGDLGDFDETEAAFDSADEISGKFDLAQMYLDMQDNETARNILNEILAEGDSEQQRKAQELMDEIA